MSKRLGTVSDSTKDVDDFQQALADVGEAASKRLPDSHAGRPTTPRRRTTSQPSLAFTPMVKLKPTKALDIPVALHDALRHAGISFAQDSIEALGDSLLQARLERDQKLRDHYQSSSLAEHDKIAERSSTADSDMRVIVDALFKHRSFQHVHLANPRLEKQLQDMERDLEAKNHELLDAENNELSLGDPRVRAFIAKYGK